LVTVLVKRDELLDFKSKIVKITIEDSLKENSKGQKPSTDLAQAVDGKLTINSNLSVTELVG